LPTHSNIFAILTHQSNGIRFSISDLSPPRSRLLHCIYRERSGISLYDSLHEFTPESKEFYFSKFTIKKVSETLARFKSICDGYEVPEGHISVFATEAMRTAKNRDEMLGAIKATSGLTVDILSPGMESLFGAMGARSGFTDVNGLFMDLGGGSVQMTYVNSAWEENYHVLAVEAAKSMPYGAAKLNVALSAQDTAHQTTEELNVSMKENFDGMRNRFPDLGKQADHADGITIYFCGGGFRGYGRMLMHTDPVQPYPIPDIGGYIVSGQRFTKFQKLLEANSQEGKIFGMSKRRREQFPAIVTVVQALIKAVPKIKQVIFCSGGNREGVLFMKLPIDVRECRLIPLLGRNVDSSNAAILDEAVHKILTAIPTGTNYTAVITGELLSHLVTSLWIDMGNLADANSAKALHDPISGNLAGLPGLTHELRAVIALIVCARWGTDLGPADKILYNNLRALLPPDLSWWCDYIGKVMSILGMVLPAPPKSEEALKKAVGFVTSISHKLGNKGHKSGIKMSIYLSPEARRGIRAGAIEAVFENVGKGLELGWKVEAEVANEVAPWQVSWWH
jgi:retrograde regulation protein 2